MISVNVTGTYHLLDSLRKSHPQARVMVASSSAMYGGSANRPKPVTEDAAVQPESLYGTAKAAQDMVAYQFFAQHGLFTVRGRTFNQVGPGEGIDRVCGLMAKQVARIESGAPGAISADSHTYAPPRLYRRARCGRGILVRSGARRTGRNVQYLLRPLRVRTPNRRGLAELQQGEWHRGGGDRPRPRTSRPFGPDWLCPPAGIDFWLAPNHLFRAELEGLAQRLENSHSLRIWPGGIPRSANLRNLR